MSREGLSAFLQTIDGLSNFAIVSKSAAKRITMGVVYSPERIDAQSEFTDPDSLEDAVHEYLEKGDLRIRKQHGSKVIGHCVGIQVWPYEHAAELQGPGMGITKQSRQVTLPKGTCYMTVKWTHEGWDDVQAGRVTGFSMGGTAVRTRGAALGETIAKGVAAASGDAEDEAPAYEIEDAKQHDKPTRKRGPKSPGQVRSTEQRRRCKTCGFTSNTGNIAKHAARTGHIHSSRVA